MKPLTVSEALKKLTHTRESFCETNVRNYERKAKDCLTCEVQGVCCTDEHFVNVRVTRLEGTAIARAVEALPKELRDRVLRRNDEVLGSLYAEPDRDGEGLTYSCPLFEPGVGCLVHSTAKPLPCIAHACYESPADLPPEEFLEMAERKVALLNNRTYGFGWTLREIPFRLAELKVRPSGAERDKLR